VARFSPLPPTCQATSDWPPHAPAVWPFNELVAHCMRCFASLSMTASADIALRAAKGLCSHALADYADDERSIR
jgi:hypothetical protein